MQSRCILLASLALFTNFGCSKKNDSSDNGSSGTKGTMLMQLVLPSKAKTSTGLYLLDTTADDFRSGAIASGKPDEFVINIKSISLSNDSGDVLPIYSSTEGANIRAKAGKVDISELFTRYSCFSKSGTPLEGIDCPCGLDANDQPVAKDSTGVCPANEDGTAPKGIVEVKTGTFTKLQVQYGIAAKMKGCVTGNYSTVGSPAVTGIHTYCTNSNKSTFQDQQGGQNADFETTSANATEMLVQLGGQTPMPKSSSGSGTGSDTVTGNYTIKGGLTINETDKANLTLVIDDNRMLRFYNQNTPTQAPNPGMPLNTSYFFTGQLFDQSVYVFAGSPGEIRGFQWWAEACNTTPKPADRICQGNDTKIVAGWMTIIMSPDGDPMVVGLMPDDDNTLTVIKGSNMSSEGVDTSVFAKTGTSFDITYKLGSDGGGTLYGVNLADSVGNTQTGTFACKIQSNDYYGKVYFKRGL